MSDTRSSHSPGQDEPDDDYDSKERYERVIGIVEHNTGYPQYPMVRRSSAATIARHANMAAEGFKRAVKAARENNDLIQWRDASGVRRLGLTDPDHLDEDDVANLEEIIDDEVTRRHVDQDVIGWCNTQLQEIREDSDD